MRIFDSLFRRLRSFVKKDSSNVELSDELQYHLERQIEENLARSMTTEQARAAAQGDFGSIAEATENCYETRGVTLFDDLIQDFHFGLRMLRKQWSITLVTVLTLALGIGACTAIFSVVNAVLIRSMPYGDAGKLVYLFTPNPRFRLPPEIFGPSNADFLDVKKQSHSYSDMTLFDQAIYNLASGDRLEKVNAAKVDADFFMTLQSEPEIGRVINASDEHPGKNRVVVISYALWQNFLAGRKDVLGSTLQLDSTAYQVIGVMPPEFGYPHKSEIAYGNSRIDTTQLWVPSALTSQERARRYDSDGSVIARLKPGVKLEEAQAEMDAIMSQLDRLHNADMRGSTALVEPFRKIALGPVKPLMWLLLGAVGLVLLIACGNAANLLLARGANRTHELGVRATLGARRGRLLRQMLTESLMLSVAAGLVGIGLAWIFQHALLKLNPGDIPRMQDATLDMRVMAFAVLVTALTSLLFGVLPSLAATHVNLAEFLKSGGMRGIAGDRKRMRSGLMVTQVALVVVLLTGAGLLLRSYANLLAVPTGYSASTVTVNIQLGPQFMQMGSQYATAQERQTFFRELLNRIQHVHGVQAAGTVNHLPLSFSESLSTIEVEGYANQKNELIETRAITPGYLSAMQIALLRGRDFTDEDVLGHPSVAIVNEAFAKKYLNGQDAVGRQVHYTGLPWTTIVGEITDVRDMGLEASPSPQVYFSMWQADTQDSPQNGGYLAVSSTLPQNVIVSETRAAVHSLDPNLALADVRSMRERETQATARRRFQTTLLTIFSGIAMLLAVVGVYGLLAYSVRQRTGEIGIRMALGSSRVRIMRLVLQEGLLLLGIGLLVGLGIALTCTRFLAGFLYAVPVVDPFTFVLVPVLLFFATLVACLIPGCKAASLDPMNALRHE